MSKRVRTFEKLPTKVVASVAFGLVLMSSSYEPAWAAPINEADEEAFVITSEDNPLDLSTDDIDGQGAIVVEEQPTADGLGANCLVFSDGSDNSAAVTEEATLEAQATDSGTIGTCQWSVSNGVLSIKPKTGNVGTLPSNEPETYEDKYEFWPWHNRNDISTIKVQGRVKCGPSIFMLFGRLPSVESIDLKGLDTSGVTEMAGLFDHDYELKELDLSGFDTSRVTDMGGMFNLCKKLRFLDITGFDTSNVTNMASMFCGCSSLGSLDLSRLDTTSIRDMNSMYAMFLGCGLKTMDLTGFDITKAAKCATLFFGNDDAHETIVVGSKFDCSKVYPFAAATAPNGKWWSFKAQDWFTPEEIRLKRPRVADTYSSVEVYDISKAMLRLPKTSYTFTGKVIKPRPTVTLGGRTLAAGADYIVSYKANKAVGTATVTVKGRGSCKGLAKKTFKIARATNPMRLKAVARTAKYATVRKKAVAVAAPLEFSKKAQGKVTYVRVAKGSSKALSVSKKTGKVTVEKGTRKGTYKIKIKVVAAGNANYAKLAKTIACKVVVK